MSNSEVYADNLFYERTNGLHPNEDSAFEELFSVIDIENAYAAGQNDVPVTTINKIFELNKKFLMYCNMNGNNPTINDRNLYIIEHWDD